jgi:hypothetical protein
MAHGRASKDYNTRVIEPMIYFAQNSDVVMTIREDFLHHHPIGIEGYISHFTFILSDFNGPD